MTRPTGFVLNHMRGARATAPKAEANISLDVAYAILAKDTCDQIRDKEMRR